MMEAMAYLPPDLSRVGDELTAAAARSLRARARRRAVAIGLATAMAVVAPAFAALAANHLGLGRGSAPSSLASTGPGSAAPVLASARTVPTGCDQPRGKHFGLPACPDFAVVHSESSTLPHGTSLWRE